MLVLSAVTADGLNEDAEVPVTIYHPRTSQPTGAVAWVTLAPQKEQYDLARKYRRHEVNPGTRQMNQVVDGVKVQQVMMAAHIKRWSGFQDAKGQELPCVPAVFNALPEWVADQITDVIRGVPAAGDVTDSPDAAEVRDAGF